MFQDRAADGLPNFTRDSPHLLLRAAGVWNWVQGAERFEAPGCLGTQGVGLADQWHRVIAELPDGDGIAPSGKAGTRPASILAEVRAQLVQMLHESRPDELLDHDLAQEKMRALLKRYFRKEMGRRPMILPVIWEM
jgi:hypothetical protein